MTDHYNAKTKRFYNTPETQALPLSVSIRALAHLLFKSHRLAPPYPLPTCAPDWKTFFTDQDKCHLIWLGHSSFLIRIAHQTILIDPIFGKNAGFGINRFQPPVIARESLPPIDLLILTHNHYDHLESATIKHFAHYNTNIIAPLGNAPRLKKYGIPASRIIEKDWWDEYHHNTLTLTCLPARHSTARGLGDKDKSLWCGWMLTSPHETLYLSGDTAFGTGEHFKHIAQRYPHIDLAIIENGQYDPDWPDNHLFPEQTAAVAKLLSPKRMLPSHWGVFSLARHQWDASIRASLPLIIEHGISPLTPKMGEVVHTNSLTEQWWENLSE